MKQFFQDNKEAESIQFILDHQDALSWVAFSGGKDSIVLADLVRKTGLPHELHFNNTGLEAPELLRFVKKNYPEAIWHTKSPHFFKMMLKKGFPTRRRRWCCDYLKKSNTPKGQKIFTGVRAEESPGRASRGQIFKGSFAPLFYWKEWEIWEYIEKNNLPYCSLYDEGFLRIGCIICPFLTGKRHEIHKKRWPKYYAIFEKQMKIIYDRNIAQGVYVDLFRDFQHFLDWYYGSTKQTDANQKHFWQVSMSSTGLKQKENASQ